MWLWRQMKQGVSRLLNPEAADQDVADEVRHYMQEAQADLVAGGATPSEARRATRLQYGDALSAREQIQAYGWELAPAQPDLRRDGGASGKAAPGQQHQQAAAPAPADSEHGGPRRGRAGDDPHRPG